LAGISIPRGNASTVYNTYRGRGQISRTGTPPAGALVFWDVARPYGHVALSVGGGQVIGTRGMDFARLPVQQYAINAIPGYLGWVMPR
jgi:cell wall-associated NlpC family hydrolase